MSSNQSLPCLMTVFALVIDDQGRILCLQRQGTGYKDGFWSLPGGHKEAHENFVDAVVRELAEETGLQVQATDAEHYLFLHRYHQMADPLECMSLFAVFRQWKGVVRNRERDKCAQLQWFDKHALPEPFIPYIHEAIHAALSGAQFLAWSGDAIIQYHSKHVAST